MSRFLDWEIIANLHTTLAWMWKYYVPSKRRYIITSPQRVHISKDWNLHQTSVRASNTSKRRDYLRRGGVSRSSVCKWWLTRLNGRWQRGQRGTCVGWFAEGMRLIESYCEYANMLRRDWQEWPQPVGEGSSHGALSKLAHFELFRDHRPNLANPISSAFPIPHIRTVSFPCDLLLWS